MGRSGLKVSEICMGAMTFGDTADQGAADRIVGLALEAGVTFFDTSNNYGHRQSEVMLGKALEGHRDDVVLATKVTNPIGPRPNDSGWSRRHIVSAVEQSLRNLRTDHLDIYYIHHVDHDSPLDEMLRALDDLVRRGKVLYVACSNFEAWRLMEALWTSDSSGLERFACYQGQYSLVVRDAEEEIVPACRHKGLGYAAWSPLASGFLSGKYPSSESFGSERRRRFFPPTAGQTLAALFEVANELGRTPAQVAIRWILERPWITSAIIGARTPEQARDNLLAGSFRLPAEAREKLDAVSSIRRRYPRLMEDDRDEVRKAAIKMPSLEF